jgi:carbamoyl-phosphate synthase small subunit
MHNKKISKLVLKDKSEYMGRSFGAEKSMAGEVVFATGMVGYPEALTDPSFRGQILVLTFPLIGNYGVPKKELWESNKIQVAGLIVCNYIDTPSHHASVQTLSKWLKEQNVPALEIKDTRGLTQKLRSEGVMLGKIVFGKDIPFENPDLRNLPAEVSTKEIYFRGDGKKTIVILDCGMKFNIARRIEARGFKVAVVPWDTDVMKLKFPFSAVVISNGPGDPMKVTVTIKNVKKMIVKKIPIFGICLGNQILALASGGKTFKLKFGHRSQNQPCVQTGTKRCFLTTQNHGFSVSKIPNGFKEWFYNANDNTNEGIIHKTLPFMSVQFHPESSPGPLDTDWIFDYFLKKAKIK